MRCSCPPCQNGNSKHCYETTFDTSPLVLAVSSKRLPRLNAATLRRLLKDSVKDVRRGLAELN